MAKRTTVEAKRADAKKLLSAQPDKPAKIRDLDGNVEVYGLNDIEVLTEDELDAVIDTILQQGKGGGRPIYNNVRELQNAINDYWESIATLRKKGIDIFPDVEGVCSHLGISRSTLMSWKNHNRNGFGETIEILFTNIAAVKKQIAMHGNMPALVFMADMNNNHGYVNTSKVDVRQTNSVEEIPDAAALIEQIRNLPDNDGE